MYASGNAKSIVGLFQDRMVCTAKRDKVIGEVLAIGHLIELEGESEFPFAAVVWESKSPIAQGEIFTLFDCRKNDLVLTVSSGAGRDLWPAKQLLHSYNLLPACC